MKNVLLPIAALMITSSISAQTYYSEDFEGVTAPALPSNATSFDVDADGEEWYVGDLTASAPFTNSGQLAISRSWSGAVLTPDNYLVLGPIDLSTASGIVSLSWECGSIETTASGWYEENYSVYLTTASDPTTISASSPVFSEILPSGETLIGNSVDVSSFSGQSVYLTFRHYNCTDENILGLDNISIKTVLPDDAALSGLSLTRYAMLNANEVLTAEVTNAGSNAITSLEIDWNDGTPHVQTIAVNIAPGATASVAHPTNVTYATAVEQNITVSITATNGGVDTDLSNNDGSILHNTLSQQTDKAVVIEEGTGTWCGWCPRGAVAMDYMVSTYPTDFIGIAVHNGDVMTVADYDNGAAISGFPGGNVDRALLGVSVSQAAFEVYYNDRVNMGVPANVSAVVSGTGSAVTVEAGIYYIRVWC